ncbi:RNA polymerase sigma factor [Saccharothrix obliqua]|uniref:RNA polymerase sigma factor n=1 Tax=Saccharothrix obliqua TaxID=2861747 RepID=UPI001C5EF5C0|nr:sigma-70 family RNA polymerase sigma factor [Saccharothrix obliqua]MBW4715790.1 sigma-70 family RNA polymerase sigma factor [Saccharothrix obliqua]
MRDHTTADLLIRAREGDHAAWEEIVRRHVRLVWAVARSHGLSHDDAADVNQTVWLLLAEHAATIRRPDRLSAWLTTAARRESLTTLRLRGRERPVDLWDSVDEAPTPEDIAIADDTRRRLWRAYHTLPDRCRRLLRLLAFAPELTFQQVAEATGIPPNSLGPTRGRCLEALRRRLATTEAVR